MESPALLDAAETLSDMPASHAIDEASDRLTDETVSDDEASNNTGDTSPDGALRRTRSRVWDHYARMPDFNGAKLVRCRYCAKQHVVSHGSTGGTC
jgi:BED zinc finger